MKIVLQLIHLNSILSKIFVGQFYYHTRFYRFLIKRNKSSLKCKIATQILIHFDFSPSSEYLHNVIDKMSAFITFCLIYFYKFDNHTQIQKSCKCFSKYIYADLLYGAYFTFNMAMFFLQNTYLVENELIPLFF